MRKKVYTNKISLKNLNLLLAAGYVVVITGGA